MRVHLLLLVAVGVGCGSAMASARSDRPPQGDSQADIAVTQPTLITSFVATQSQLTSSPEANEALADYQYYLSRAVPILQNHGVAIVATNDSTVRWRDSLGRHSIVAADSGGILYLFVLPSGRVKALHAGVELDGALLAVARDHFGLPIRVPQIDSL